MAFGRRSSTSLSMQRLKEREEARRDAVEERRRLAQEASVGEDPAWFAAMLTAALAALKSDLTGITAPCETAVFDGLVARVRELQVMAALLHLGFGTTSDPLKLGCPHAGHRILGALRHSEGSS